METDGSQRGERPGPLEAYVDAFLDDQRIAGYSPNTLAERRAVTIAFARWAKRHAIAEGSLGEEHVQSFIRRRPPQCSATESERATVRRFLAYLRACGVMPSAPSQPDTPAEALVARYITFLRKDRGLAERSILVYAPCARAFLATRQAQAGRLALDQLDAKTIHAFLLGRIRNHASESSRLVTVALRSLLRFLFLRGETPRDLSAAVPTMRTYREAGVPALLTPEEVEEALASPDRSTSKAGATTPSFCCSRASGCAPPRWSCLRSRMFIGAPASWLCAGRGPGWSPCRFPPMWVGRWLSICAATGAPPPPAACSCVRSRRASHSRARVPLTTSCGWPSPVPASRRSHSTSRTCFGTVWRPG